MRLTINGEAKDVDDGITVEALLVSLGAPLVRVAVEVNGDIVKKADRAGAVLRAGDVVEIVTLVGGG